MRHKASRWAIGIVCVLGLTLVYLFQRYDVAASVGVSGKMNQFFVNRTIRFFLNDAFMIGLIYALFIERKYVVFALWVQLFGIVFFLLPYFVLKYNFPGYNGPLISFLHRLILNPTLLILLIPAFYYQRSRMPSPSRATRDKLRREDAK
jgi:exosortase F-associated protein